MSVDHYENFPVASVLLPRRLRLPVSHIYRFARTADDIADEGELLASERLRLLEQYEESLQNIQHGLPITLDSPHYAVFAPLAQVIQDYSLPLRPFHDLLSAFKQDVTVQRYPDMTALLNYCQRSADPVGRLMLHLYGKHDAELLAQADAICTGLQLTNFWQDIAIDWYKGRVYIPQELLSQYGLSDEYLAQRCQRLRQPATDAQWLELMSKLVQDARERLKSGLPLCRALPGRIGLELKLIVLGGLRILERLDQVAYDVFSRRPTLGKSDWLLLVWRGLRPYSFI